MSLLHEKVSYGNGYHAVKIDGSYIRCVACNKPIEHSDVTGMADHKCPENHESARLATKRRFDDCDVIERTESIARRINIGFEMLELDSEESE